MSLPTELSYLRLTLRTLISENLDYSDPLRSVLATLPDRILTRWSYGIIQASNSIYMEPFAASNPIMGVLYNPDDTAVVTLTYYTLGGGATAQTCKIPPGDFVVLPDLDTRSTDFSITTTAGTGGSKVEAFFAQFVEADA